MDIAEAVAAQKRGDLTPEAFVRLIMGPREWHLPARSQEDGQTGLALVKNEEGTWLQVFSKVAYLRAYVASRGEPAEMVTVDGHRVGQMLEPPITGVNFDAGTEHGFHYTEDRLPMLKRMSEATRIAQILAGERVAGSWQALRDYAHWRVAYGEGADDGSRQLMLAPDGEGNRLVAVFSAPDTSAAFCDAVHAQLGFQPELLEVPGEDLFKTLATLPVDGMVFDPAGPIAPCAVKLAFAQRVLERSSAN